jgi:hypothetical protein
MEQELEELKIRSERETKQFKSDLKKREFELDAFKSRDKEHRGLEMRLREE